ncbi:hypothetical protein A8708_20775 [Paenibacillus oryzisoli]|uniref:DUF3888 domain-containing protein n=2 Tax=Paenibacillus oryzisoli TaxID=1850517 RepID=A0A198A5M9_9BACL|nr:hypothetical protein A8708_20775 [Paenibacillus oryzisoli]
MRWLITLMLLGCVSCLAGCSAYALQHDLSSEVRLQQQEDVKLNVKQLLRTELEKDKDISVGISKRIINYKIHDDIGIVKKEKDTYFIVKYDILPASLEFIIVGGGERTEDGWIKNCVRYVTLEE